MSPPPAKRQRTDVPTKHSEFWFSDGSVVLQAVNTQFRVHWSLLARHSLVFCDMQGLPQPSDEPSVDGCPVVQLQDDPTDVEFLLSTLYDPAFLSQKTLPLAAVGALIRLGRKYGFRVFLKSAVARITSHYPAVLEEYDIVKNSGGTRRPSSNAQGLKSICSLL
ncbi:BTB domain-containing protein [Mycena sanguinolenta]|uniref:BTB domain-containing protein n=1 Tax=Mycena sanguinolenta TaxID=230812 RepID=A0A8H6Z5W1_9AGAR|nr:BTB domain-containing protein [Mycena sanguinolenta]